MLVSAEKLIKKYGNEIIINNGTESKKSYAIIQCLRSDDQSSLYGDYNSQNHEQYLYIGVPNKLSGIVSPTITYDGKTYTVIKLEKVIVSGKTVYERAVLEGQ